MTAEIPLTGGNVSASVVRIGDTVRKPITAHTPNVAALLAHLTAKGIKGVPQHLGTDDQNRQILEFLPGDTAFPSDIWTSPKALTHAAQMLRQIHDASIPLLQTHPSGWAYAYPDTNRHEVICHNDFAPYNMVFRNGLPTGVIDWDLAGPGPRLRDLAYLAYWLVPLGLSGTEMTPHARTDIKNGHPRLRLICQSYGTTDTSDLIDMVDHVLAHMGSKPAATAMIGAQAAQNLEDGGHFAHWLSEHAAFLRAKPDFCESLRSNPL